ncbi:DUF1652 domain-containing protein [Pseudomonas sp. LS44]|uniref:DUF1652 domain-containing protein n=1 Tax=Pseudomonas sp. LS44 TaxID=1357074 RepID=UPI00215B4312|nr:DUF1652 domain-containing protein [Pseudomonas sp. LS44]UVE19513.1 DUF1652 domain-containing protein [Pseudomonas sp. LS44]
MSQLSLVEATRITEQAFLPHHCTTTLNSEDASFSFRVFGENGAELFVQAHVARSQYSDWTHLAGLLELARLELSKDGYALTPWSMPGENPSRR